MADFRKYEEMKKAELVEMCGLFGFEVGAKDTKQILIDKLNNRNADPKDSAAPKTAETEKTVKPTKPLGATGKRRRRGPTKDEREHAAKKKNIKETTEEMLERRDADVFIEGLRPKVVRTPPKVDTTNRYWEEKQQQLAASMVDPYHTLKGRIEGPKSTETVEVPGVGSIMYVNYAVEFGPFTVLIPSFKFWDVEEWRDQKKHPASKLYEQGLEMMGAEVEFNMTKKDQGVTTEYYGTRLFARKLQRCNNWYATLPDGRWAIDEGSLVEAQIMRVRQYELIVEVYGVEASVPIREISHFYEAQANSIKDADGNLKYRPGVWINARVSNIKRDPLPKGNLSRFSFPVTFDLSIKDAYENPQLTFFDKYDKGDTKYGEVVNIHVYKETGKQLYFVKVRDQIVSAADLAPGVGKSGHLPKIGSRVKIRIKDKVRKDHSFYSLITWVDPSNGEAEEFGILDI